MNTPLRSTATLMLAVFCALLPCAARAANSRIAMTVRLAAMPAPALALGEFWVPTQYVDETPPTAGNRFGYSVRMAGDLLVVGAPYANNDPGPTTASGRAFIYRLVGGIWQFEKLLTAPTPQSNAHFGLAVAVSTQTVPVVVVGEPDRDDANGDDVGYVWIWTYVNGAWQNTDVKYVIHAGDRFGAALDVAGDYIAAGVPGFDVSPMPDGQNRGYVETLNRCNMQANTWCFAYSYEEPGLPADAHLGSSIAIAGEYIISGAPSDNPNNVAGAGSAWINNLHSNGPLAAPIKLTDPTPATHETFGASVAGNGAVFAVGSPIDDEPMGEANSGAVHIFALSGNTAPFEATLRSPAPQSNASFGSAIALAGNRVVIGEPFRAVFFFGSTAADAGAAHVFRRFFVPSGYTWANVTTIYNYFGSDELFGAAVETLDGTQFAAGARNRNVDAVPGAGEVIVYRADALFADGFD